jgi:hypothetical protein
MCYGILRYRIAKSRESARSGILARPREEIFAVLPSPAGMAAGPKTGFVAAMGRG